MSESTYLQPFPCQMSEDSLFLRNDGMKRLVFYVEAPIILQKQTVLTHMAWERTQICSPQPGFGTGRERDGIAMREGCGKGTGIYP